MHVCVCVRVHSSVCVCVCGGFHICNVNILFFFLSFFFFFFLLLIFHFIYYFQNGCTTIGTRESSPSADKEPSPEPDIGETCET